jgi:putative transposase
MTAFSITNLDRFRLVFLSHFTAFWKQTLHIVQPDTLLRWHRELFQFYWRRKSQGKPKISPETTKGEYCLSMIRI